MTITSTNPPQPLPPIFVPKWHLKLTVWIGCNVLFVFVPFLADIAIKSSSSLAESNYMLANILFFFATWYTRKEVLIISTAVAADAFGSLQLIGEQSTAKSGLMIGCFLVGIASCLLYGSSYPPADFIKFVFLVTLIVAGISKLKA